MDEIDITRLILIPAGPSCWEMENRLVGNADLPVCPESFDQVNRWAEQLKSTGINILYSGPSGPAQETARMIAGALRVRHRTEKDLSEANLGLWQGMFLEEIKRRHPKVYRQWLDQPDSVTPPEGERMVRVQERLERCVSRMVKKHQGQIVGVVLGQIALSVARISREKRTITAVWQLVKEPLTWHEYVIKCNGVSV
ncbi:MAG: histidine phosphatase family protein [Phycisphaerae bacterium]